MYNSHPLIKPLPPKATPLVCPDFSVNRYVLPALCKSCVKFVPKKIKSTTKLNMHKCANVPAINNACTIYGEPRCMAMERIT